MNEGISGTIIFIGNGLHVVIQNTMSHFYGYFNNVIRVLVNGICICTVQPAFFF